MAVGIVSVRGRVRNGATGAFLEGALVEVPGASRSALTERDGRFALDHLPGGPVVLVVSYTGLETERVAVTPSEAHSLDVVLGSNLVQLEEYVVSELREGNAHAITQQKNAINVKEVVSTDAFGNLRDGNVAELLVQLPGVVGEWVSNDIRSVQIRGFSSNLGTVTMDGSKLANAESARTDRNFEFDALSADHIESVEVIKAPTPDMDADSIGGTVNLITKSAFDFSDKRRIKASLGGTYHRVRGDRVYPNASVSYSELFGKTRNFGLSFNWGYSRHYVGNEGTQMTYPTTTAVPNYIRRIRIFDQEGQWERTGGGLKFDYKFNERSTAFVNVLYSTYNQTLGKDANPRRIFLSTNAAAVVPGYSDDRVEWRNTRNTTARQEINIYPKVSELVQVGAGAKHRLERWTIDYDASFSIANTAFDSIKHKAGSTRPIIRGVGLILDRTGQERYFPTITQTSGPGLWDIAKYSAEPWNHRDWRGYDEVTNAQLNVERALALRHPLTLRFGARYRQQERDALKRDRRYNYLGPDGRANSGDEGLARFTEDYDHAMVGGRYPAPRWISVHAFSEAQAANPSWFEEDVVFHEQSRLGNNRSVAESVTAGYAMGTLEVGPLSILGGVRYEVTEVEGKSNLQTVTPTEAARRAAWVGPVTTEEALRRVRAEYGTRIRNTSEYDHVFPGLHLRYEPRRGLVLRASYSTSIGRPNFGSIIPDTEVNHDTRVLSATNTDLEPQRGKSLNLGAQYYIEPVGLVSANYFETRISDFIFSTTGVVGA
ncbi:MAG: TonB-dependent receptor, partial [Opitutaceae bacterium]